MSLFKCKEWWSVNLNETESYDSQCLLVAVIGKDRYQSILLGSHEGFLRVYGPVSGMKENGEVIGYKPTDLLMEMHLPAPILQLGLGTLVSGCQERNLAVLHPKVLTVYAFQKKEAEDALGDKMNVEVVYQHQLRHSAYSFVVGPFGRGRGRDFICVQALDGLLSFYEQETFAFQVYLPDFLLPSPFVYIDKIDCFVFLNSSMVLDCYSYENLASDGEAKKIPRYWSYNLGECVLDMQPVVTDRWNIVVLTERNLYDVSESGQAIFMKRLDYTPIAFTAFAAAEGKKLIIVIATDNYLLNIYEGTCLKWSAKVDQIPVSVDRIILSNLYGGIVLLSEDGYLQCVYLGTHPSVYLLPRINQPEISIMETEAELKRLYEEIKEKDIADPAELDVVGVELHVDGKPTVEEDRTVCRFSVEVTNETSVNKVQIAFVVEPPLTTAVRTCTVSCSDKTVVDNSVFVGKPGTIAGLEIAVYVSYVNNNGTPFVVERHGHLPLSLVLERTSPTREAKHKITIVTNKAVCPLNTIFREFAEEDGNPNVLGLKYVNSDSVVTVLTAKTTQRYRLQSDYLPAVTLVLTALIDRLKKHFHAAGDFTIAYDGALPLQTYFESINEYHVLLKRRKTARERLSKRTGQYRTIQKKVLVNLKDVTPKPIANLSGLLTETHGMIVSSVTELEELESELELSRYDINSLCSLLIALMEVMTIAVNDLACLRIVFSGHVYDTDDQGWLETQLAAAAFFLRTTLAKSMRDQQKPTEITLDAVTNVSKLAKTLSTVFDRATKGTHLLERSEYEREILLTIPGIKEEGEETGDLIPEGSRLAGLETRSPTLLSRKEKRLTKQERVDSLGTICDSSNAEEEAPEIVRIHRKDEEEEEDVKLPKMEKKSSFDSVEDDAIWDVKVDEMRI